MELILTGIVAGLLIVSVAGFLIYVPAIGLFAAGVVVLAIALAFLLGVCAGSRLNRTASRVIESEAEARDDLALPGQPGRGQRADEPETADRLASRVL